MTFLEQVADGLALEVLKAVDETGNEDIIEEVKKTVGASSTTLEEAYMTAIRVRRSEQRGLAALEAVMRKING